MECSVHVENDDMWKREYLAINNSSNQFDFRLGEICFECCLGPQTIDDDLGQDHRLSGQVIIGNVTL